MGQTERDWETYWKHSTSINNKEVEALTFNLSLNNLTAINVIFIPSTTKPIVVCYLSYFEVSNLGEG